MLIYKKFEYIVHEHFLILRIRLFYQVKFKFLQVLMILLLDILIIVNQFSKYFICLFVNML